MRHIDDILDVPPSTSPRLDPETIRSLPWRPVVHLTPLREHDGSGPTFEGVRQLDWSDEPWAFVVPNSWDADRKKFNTFLPFLDTDQFDSLEELCESHDVRYLRLPRLSCALTTAAVRAGTKTVTRRLSGRGIQPGALLNLTNGSRRPGVLVLATVVVSSVRTEKLREMHEEDLALEGVAAWSLEEFVGRFLAAHGLPAGANPEVYRIEFEYLNA